MKKELTINHANYSNAPGFARVHTRRQPKGGEAEAGGGCSRPARGVLYIAFDLRSVKLCLFVDAERRSTLQNPL